MNISQVEWLLPTHSHGLPGGEVTEVALLLPSWEAAALEEQARRRGLTLGQLLRHLVQGAVQQDGSDEERGEL